MQKKDSTSSVQKFLWQEKKYYDQLLLLVKKQVDCIDQEDQLRLEAVMEEKTVLLQAARENESEIEPIIAKLSEEKKELIEREVGGLRKEVEAILEQIIELENSCQTDLKARKFLVRDKILDLKQKRALLQGYGGSQRIKPKISKNV